MLLIFEFFCLKAKTTIAARMIDDDAVAVAVADVIMMIMVADNDGY